ncbi:MAG: hypothetical protein ACK56T_16975 [Dolichospermum sp.]
MWYKYIRIAVSIWLLQIGKGTGNREQGTGRIKEYKNKSVVQVH